MTDAGEITVVLHHDGADPVAEIIAPGILIRSGQDVLDLMFRSELEEADRIILHRRNLAPEFFRLATGVAGEVVQKFVNYRVRVAIVGDFAGEKSETLQAFIRESNRGRQIRFVPTVEAAREALA